MGQMKQNPTDLTLTPVQKIIFDEFAKNSNLTKMLVPLKLEELKSL